MQTCPGSIALLSNSIQIRAALRPIFREIGWRVREARAVSELPQLLTQDPNAVILTEHSLPDGGWADVLAIALVMCPQARVVVTGKLADEALWAEVLNQGGFDVLAQPLDRSEVIRVMTSAWLHSHPQFKRAAV